MIGHVNIFNALSEDYRNLINIYYNESHRKYHTFKHIDNCLNELDIIGRLKLIDEHNYALISYAILFHDIIYNPKSNKNEEDSVDIALNYILNQTVIPKNDLNKIIEMIIATKHNKIYHDININYLLDIDLSVLGYPEKEFLEYEEGIRYEYSFVDDYTYRRERIKFLQGILDRKDIYITDYFRNKYEENAIKNIIELIEILSN